MNAFPHQVSAAQIMAPCSSFLLADEPGLGKTVSLVLTVSANYRGGLVLVVCPRNVLRHWRATFAAWAPQVKILVTNYEQLGKLDRGLNPVTLIIDESHKLKNESSERFQRLYPMLQEWRTASVLGGYELKVYLATGTPVYSYPIDLMTGLLLMQQLDPARVPAFKARYCNPTRRKLGGNRVLDLRGASNLDELRRACQPFILRRTWKDAGIKMPAVTLTDLYVKEKIKSPEYFEASADFGTWYKANGGTAAGAAMARFTVLRRIIAMAKVPSTVEQTLDDLKAGQKVIVFTEFRDSAQAIHDALLAEGFTSHMIRGGQSEKERDGVLTAFRVDDGSAAALVATTDSLGEGTDGLQDVCRVATFNDLDFEPAMFVQALRRIWRIGQRHPVAVRRVFIEDDEMEEFIQANFLKKERVQRQLGLEDSMSLTNLQK